MYHISQNGKTKQRKRWVLLEQLPTILSPKILILIFLYAMAFVLLCLGLRVLQLQDTMTDAASSLTSSAGSDSSALLYRNETPAQIQENIASQVIRLHVIANSDSQDDQSLKLHVRDAVIQDLQSSLASADSVKDARSILLSHISQIEDTAGEAVAAEGYSYPVKVTLETRYFPVKVYGDLRFPAGDYEALCLQIGSAQGKNWWCVLYPSLCFVDETYAVVPKKSKQKLKKSLSQEEYSSLEIHSALYDWIKKKKK
jgi:stage II sporulation protein R